MPVRVGKSYVSEAAYSYAQSKLAEEIKEEKGGSVLKDLSERFRETNFLVGTRPFAGTGTNNISIAPNILRRMEQDPEKRLEYEALIYDCNECMKNGSALGGRNVKAYGFIIDSEGGLRAWSISGGEEGNRRHQAGLNKKDKGSWLEQLLPPPREKQPAGTAAREAARAKESRSFADKKEFLSYLRDNYRVVKEGHASISDKYLRDCLADEDKQQSLFEKLAAADMALSELEEQGGLISMQVEIDEKGEMTLTSGRRTVTFNGTKRARQIAAAQSSSDINTVMNLLQVDLAQCQDGLRDGACDEAEVEKVKAMIERAQQRQGELQGKQDTGKFDAFSVNLLI